MNEGRSVAAGRGIWQQPISFNLAAHQKTRRQMFLRIFAVLENKQQIRGKT
jgi:hypothetical protein